MNCQCDPKGVADDMQKSSVSFAMMNRTARINAAHFMLLAVTAPPDVKNILTSWYQMCADSEKDAEWILCINI